MLTLLLATPAWGQGLSCTDRASALKNLSKRYGETVTGFGINNAGNMIQLVVTEDGSTWSLIATMPDGQTCMITHGEGWRTREWKPNDPRT